MAPSPVGSKAPDLPGVDLGAGPTALFFYKVTCPVCQMAAPALQAFEAAYPGRVVGIGQDPQTKLDDFARTYGLTFGSHVDSPPYPVSDTYGVSVVPTLFVVDARGVIDAVMESWDRDGINQASKRLAELLHRPYAQISQPGDGLPSFRPG